MILKGGAVPAPLIIFGGDDVSDVKRAIEVALAEVGRAGDVYANDVDILNFNIQHALVMR